MSNMFLLFVLLALGFMGLLALIIYRGWGAPPTGLATTQNNEALMVFKARLQELDVDLQQQRMDAELYTQLKTELQRQLLASHMPASIKNAGTGNRYAGFLFGVFPVLGLLVYFAMAQLLMPDQHQQLWSYWQARQQFDTEAEQLLTGKIAQPSTAAITNPNAFVQALQSNAYQHAADAQRWLALSRVYTVAEVPGFAMSAIEHAYRLAPEDDSIAMTYARLRFDAQQGKMDELTRQMVQHVLEKRPHDEAAMTLLAMGAFGNKQYTQALATLQQMRHNRIVPDGQVSDTDTTAIKQLDSAISMVQQAQAKAASQVANPEVAVVVSLPASLEASLKAEDTLFVFVKALHGSPQPYAVQKIAGTQVLEAIQHAQSLHFVLSNQNSMLPSRNLSSAQDGQVALVAMARLSHSNSPLPDTGDVESLPVPVRSLAGQGTITLDLTQVVP